MMDRSSSRRAGQTNASFRDIGTSLKEPGSTTNKGNLVCGLHLVTLLSSLACAGLYGASTVLMLATNCPSSPKKNYVLLFNLSGIIGVVAMALVNLFSSRYKIDGRVLAVTFVYAGTAMLILFGLIYMGIEGLCIHDRQVSIFATGFAPDLIVWVLNLFGLLCQVLGYFKFT